MTKTTKTFYSYSYDSLFSAKMGALYCLRKYFLQLSCKWCIHIKPKIRSMQYSKTFGGYFISQLYSCPLMFGWRKASSRSYESFSWKIKRIRLFRKWNIHLLNRNGFLWLWIRFHALIMKFCRSPKLLVETCRRFCWNDNSKDVENFW